MGNNHIRGTVPKECKAEGISDKCGKANHKAESLKKIVQFGLRNVCNGIASTFHGFFNFNECPGGFKLSIHDYGKMIHPSNVDSSWSKGYCFLNSS